MPLSSGLRGQVVRRDDDGDALVDFETQEKLQWVARADICKLRKAEAVRAGEATPLSPQMARTEPSAAPRLRAGGKASQASSSSIRGVSQAPESEREAGDFASLRQAVHEHSSLVLQSIQCLRDEVSAALAAAERRHEACHSNAAVVQKIQELRDELVDGLRWAGLQGNVEHIGRCQGHRERCVEFAHLVAEPPAQLLRGAPRAQSCCQELGVLPVREAIHELKASVDRAVAERGDGLGCEDLLALLQAIRENKVDMEPVLFTLRDLARKVECPSDTLGAIGDGQRRHGEALSNMTEELSRLIRESRVELACPSEALNPIVEVVREDISSIHRTIQDVKAELKTISAGVLSEVISGKVMSLTSNEVQMDAFKKKRPASTIHRDNGASAGPKGGQTRNGGGASLNGTRHGGGSNFGCT